MVACRRILALLGTCRDQSLCIQAVKSTCNIATVYPEILVIFLIWQFGGQDQNCQFSTIKFT